VSSPEPPARKPRFFYGWVIVVVVALAGFSTSTESFPVLGVFLKPITEDLGWTRAEFTAPISIGGLLGGLLALMVGPMVDRYGSRWTLTIAFGLLGASFVLMSFMGSVWQFFGIQLVARSMNTGVIAVATAVIIPNWFLAKRGKALSLSSMGFPMGGAAMPIIVQALSSLWGWRAATLGAGLIIWIVSMVPTAIFIRRRPEDQGLLPDGAAPAKADADAPPRSDMRAGVEEPAISRNAAMRMPSFYLILGAGSLWWFARTGLVLHAIPYLTDKGLSPGVAVSAIVLHSMVAVLGTFVAGFLRDRFTIRFVMAAHFALTALAFVLVLSVTSAWMALAWAVFYGALQGMANPLQRLIFADYFGRRHLGAITGVSRAVQNVFQAAGPLVAATFYDVTNSYQLIFTVFIFVNIAATASIVLARPPHRALADVVAPPVD
jgi:sugar phosphate permease